MFKVRFGKYSFLTMMFNAMFLSFSDEGDGGDVGDTGDTGDTGSQDTGDNDTGTQDTPTVEQLQEQLKAFEGVDVEKYNSLKDIDPEVAKEAMSIFEKIKDNKELLDQINKPPQDPTEADRLAKLEARIKEEDNKKEYDKFMSSTEKALEEALKENELELVSDGVDEKDIIIRKVIETFQNDENEAQAKGLKQGKLSWDDIPRIVKEQTKSLADYRKAILSKSIKKGAMPDMTGGDPSSTRSKDDNKIISDAQRRKELAQEIEALSNSSGI